MRNPSRLSGTPVGPQLEINVVADPASALCALHVQFGPVQFQLGPVALDDAEGVANLILAKVKEAREGASPIVVVPGMGGLKS